MLRPDGLFVFRQAWGDQASQRLAQSIAHTLADLVPVQTHCQSLPQLFPLQRFSPAQQRDVADLGGWPHRFLQLSG